MPQDSAFRDAAVDVFSSICGSAACTYTGQPFDTVKVRMQTSAAFSGPVDCFLDILRREGLPFLWRGAVPAFLGAVSENAMCFGINGHLTRMIAAQSTVPKDLEPFLTGALTGMCTPVVLAPFELIKSRAQIIRSTDGTSGNFSTILRGILESHGPKMLYSGLLAQTLSSSIFYFSFFGSYSVISRRLRECSPLSDSAVYLLSGGFAGQIGWIACLPLDTIKTRIQVVHHDPPRFREVARTVWRANGLRGFYRGVEATLIRAFPANAALFFAYEWTKLLLSSPSVA